MDERQEKGRGGPKGVYHPWVEVPVGFQKKQLKVNLEGLFYKLDDKGFSHKNQAQKIMVANLQNSPQ